MAGNITILGGWINNAAGKEVKENSIAKSIHTKMLSYLKDSKWTW